MIFSQEKWDDGAELQRVIRSSSAVDFPSFSTILREAFDLFIRSVLGKEMCAALIKEYLESDALTELVALAQRANANLAVWYNFNELTVILSGSGVQRAETGEYKGLYKYQERQIRDGYKNKGFDALDSLLCYLESNVSEYPDFKQSPAWKQRTTALVPGADTIQPYLPIGSSRLIFLRLQPHLIFIEKTRLPSLIGSELAAKILSDEALKEFVRPVIILLSAARLVRQSGLLSDKGLYFSSVLAGMSGNDETLIPATIEQAEYAAKQYEADANEYLSLADQYIKECYPDLFRGKASKVFDVDNNDKKIFWGV